MSEALYERYKDALRRGHVAAMRGRSAEALEAYGEAARIAPDRALPLTGIASVLLRLGKRQEAEAEARRDAFAGYVVDDALLDAAGPGVIAMHCLPAHRGEEITSAVMDGPRSRILEQSENRLHVQKALLVELIGPS